MAKGMIVFFAIFFLLQPQKFLKIRIVADYCNNIDFL